MQTSPKQSRRKVLSFITKKIIFALFVGVSSILIIYSFRKPGLSWQRDKFKYIPNDFFGSESNSDTNQTQKFIARTLSPKVLPPVSYQVINAQQTSQIIATRGTRLDIPANAFVDARGRIVKGPVAITITEVIDALDFVTAGVPLIHEKGPNQIEYFKSAGMFFIKAKNGEKEVHLHRRKKITVQFPNIEPGNEFYVYKIKNEKWQLNGHNQEGNTKADILTIGTRKYQIDELNTWWNFDKPEPTVACITGTPVWENGEKVDYRIFSIGISYKGSFSQSHGPKDNFRINVHKSSRARFLLIDNNGNIGISPVIAIWDKAGFDNQPNGNNNQCQKIGDIRLKKISKSIAESKEALSRYLGLTVSKHKVNYQK